MRLRNQEEDPKKKLRRKSNHAEKDIRYKKI